MYKEIKIDLDVYKTIENGRYTFEETPNSILRRLLKLDSSIVDDSREVINESIASTEIGNTEKGLPIASNNSANDWVDGNVRLAWGTKLQKWYLGQKYEAIIEKGAIYYKGKPYHSPSAAAMVITDGINTNGWTFWEYFDSKTNQWKRLKKLKK